jgi:phenylalanyl-tRNA synthetase beta chain
VRLGADGRAAGRIGELHPFLIARLGLRAERVIFAELDLAPLLAAAATNVMPRIAPVPRHPGAERDVAVVVPERTPADDVRRAIVAAGRPLLRTAVLFDRYAGAPLGDDEVSLAFRLRFAADERTLTEVEVDERMAAIVEAVRAYGGRIRE